MHPTKVFWLAALFGLVAGLGTVRADTIYSSEAAFQAAIAAPTVFTFDGIASAGGYVEYGMTPLPLGGVTFAGNDDMFVIDPGYYGFPYADGGFLNSDYASQDTVTASWDTGVTAVGFDYGSLFPGGADFTVTFSNGDSFSLSTTGSTADGSLGFFGATFDTPVTAVTLTMPDSPNYNAIDNFTLATAAPEPGCLGVVGIGLLGAFAAFRKRLAH